MLGNDVVDLTHAEARPGGVSARFDGRVFSDDERRLVEATDAPGGASGRIWRWRLWAAKEAAYKSLRKADGELSWSPIRFQVRLDAAGVTVEHAASRVPVRWFEGPRGSDEPEWLHAVAGEPPGDAARIVSQVVLRRDEDDSEAVRRRVRETAAALAGIDTSRVRVETHDRIPVLRVEEARHDLSLSHHGRFVAFAFDRTARVASTHEAAA